MTYRNQTDLEADAIVALHDGRWGAVEIKMGQAKIEQAASNLLRLRNRVDEEKMNPPSFLMVLTGNGYAMRRKDGVLVVPVTCLKA